MIIVILNVDSNETFANVAIYDNYNSDKPSNVARVDFNTLVNTVVSKGLTPLNFSIDREGKIVQDCGSFKRFSNSGVAIVLAELTTKSGRPLGYRIIQSTNGLVKNLRLEEILAMERKLGRPFMQNGIVRNNTVNCYPLHPFYRIEVGTSTKKKSETRNLGRSSKGNENVPNKVKKEDSIFSKAQLAEINRCKDFRLDSSFIENPKLSPKQMRILTDAKKDGCCAEYFNNPSISNNDMRFFAEYLYDERFASECGLMIEKAINESKDHTELFDVLVECVFDGIDYSDLLNMSASEADVERFKRTNTLWTGNKDDLQMELFEKGMNYAMKLEGYC